MNKIFYSKYKICCFLAASLVFMLSQSPVVNAFSECRNSNIPDPDIPGVTNCQQWLAYANAVQGVNIVQWCSDSANFQKCCLTCENYLSINQCNDKASEFDCKNVATKGLCDVQLFNSIKMSDICTKSCNRCPLNNYLSCDNLARNCSFGTCLPITLYRRIPTVQCLCEADYGGYYCQQKNFCSSFNPCMNGGTCSPLYDDDAMYRCTCPFGFSGRHCQTNTIGCNAITCFNGGQCLINSNGSPYCSCPLEYSGLRCQNYVGGCYSNPCLNGGTCVSQPNSGYFCFCPPNYTGKNCNFGITYELCLNGDRNRTLCSVWSMYKFCDFNYLYESTPVPFYCPVSCNLCNNFCQDKSSDCGLYARLNLCSLVNAQNPSLCRKTCDPNCVVTSNS